MKLSRCRPLILLLSSSTQNNRNAPVAQLDRVSDYESEGRWFESIRACQNTKVIRKGGFVIFCVRVTNHQACMYEPLHAVQWHYGPVLWLTRIPGIKADSIPAAPDPLRTPLTLPSKTGVYLFKESKGLADK